MQGERCDSATTKHTLKIWEPPHSGAADCPTEAPARAFAETQEETPAASVPSGLFTADQVAALLAAISPGTLVRSLETSHGLEAHATVVNTDLNDQRTVNPLVARRPKKRGLTAAEVAEIADAFWDHAETSLKPRTVADYRTFWTSYTDFARSSGHSDDSPRWFSPSDVSKWLRATKWGPTRRGTAIASLKAVLNWAAKNGLIKRNPIADLSKPTPRRRKTFVTTTTWDALLAAIEPNDPFRDYVILAWETGARPSELTRLTSAHVDLTSCRAELSEDESKTNTVRHVYLSPLAVEVLSRLIPLAGPGQPLLRNTKGRAWTLYALNCRCRRLRKRLNLKSLSPYEFRHGFCFHKLDTGTDLLTTSKLMGHTTPDMVAKVYSHIEQNQRLLRAAVGS